MTTVLLGFAAIALAACIWKWSHGNKPQVALIVLMIMAGGGGLYSLLPPASRTDTSADDESPQASAAIRRAGYVCDRVLSIDRIRVLSDGAKVYKIACGYQGPFYAVTVAADGTQTLRPMD